MQIKIRILNLKQKDESFSIFNMFSIDMQFYAMVWKVWIWESENFLNLFVDDQLNNPDFDLAFPTNRNWWI